jgi:uncharacterized protein YbaR (Trm112 family)
VDKYLLERLVCPQTGGSLQFDAQASELISVAGQLAYPVRDGIPVMLVNEARALSGEELETWRAKGAKKA